MILNVDRVTSAHAHLKAERVSRVMSYYYKGVRESTFLMKRQYYLYHVTALTALGSAVLLPRMNLSLNRVELSSFSGINCNFGLTEIYH